MNIIQKALRMLNESYKEDSKKQELIDEALVDCDGDVELASFNLSNFSGKSLTEDSEDLDDEEDFDDEDDEDEPEREIDLEKLADDIIGHCMAEGDDAFEIKKMIEEKDDFMFNKLVRHEHTELFDDEDECWDYCKAHEDELFKTLEKVFYDNADWYFDPDTLSELGLDESCNKGNKKEVKDLGEGLVTEPDLLTFYIYDDLFNELTIIGGDPIKALNYLKNNKKAVFITYIAEYGGNPHNDEWDYAFKNTDGTIVLKTYLYSKDEYDYVDKLNGDVKKVNESYKDDLKATINDLESALRAPKTSPKYSDLIANYTTVENARKELKELKKRYNDLTSKKEALNFESNELSDMSVKERRDLANSTTDANILKQLSKDEDGAVRCYVAKNDATPIDVLKQLANDEDEEVRGYVADCPNTPLDILKKLANDEEGWVRQAVAENPDTPVYVLEKLAKDPVWSVRNSVANNHNTSPEILSKLLRDENEDIRKNAAKNPNASELDESLNESKDDDDTSIDEKQFIEDILYYVNHTGEYPLYHKTKKEAEEILQKCKEALKTYIEYKFKNGWLVKWKDGKVYKREDIELVTDKNNEFYIIADDTDDLDESLTESTKGNFTLQKFKDAVLKDLKLGFGKDGYNKFKNTYADIEAYIDYILEDVLDKFDIPKKFAKDPKNMTQNEVNKYFDYLKDKYPLINQTRKVIEEYFKLNESLNEESEELDYLYDMDDEELKSLAKNTTDANILRELADDVFDQYTHYNVADNPNCPVDVLEKLAEEENSYVCTAIALNKNTPADVLNKLGNDSSWFVRKCVAKHKNTPEGTLMRMRADKDSEVRQAVAENPNTPVWDEDANDYIIKGKKGSIKTTEELVDCDGDVEKENFTLKESVESSLPVHAMGEAAALDVIRSIKNGAAVVDENGNVVLDAHGDPVWKKHPTFFSLEYFKELDVAAKYRGGRGSTEEDPRVRIFKKSTFSRMYSGYSYESLGSVKKYRNETGKERSDRPTGLNFNAYSDDKDLFLKVAETKNGKVLRTYMTWNCKRTATYYISINDEDLRECSKDEVAQYLTAAAARDLQAPKEFAKTMQYTNPETGEIKQVTAPQWPVNYRISNIVNIKNFNN